MDHDHLTEHARNAFRDDRFAAQAGISIVAVGTHEATCHLTLGEHHRNARGAAMGGVLFTLADFAAAAAANSECLDNLQWVSLDSTIHYLSPAFGGTLEARCTALKAGRTTALFQTEIDNLDDGKRIAIVETTMIHV